MGCEGLEFFDGAVGGVDEEATDEFETLMVTEMGGGFAAPFGFGKIMGKTDRNDGGSCRGCLDICANS